MKTNYFFLIAALISVMTVSATPMKGLQFTGASASYINVGQNSAFAPTEFTIEAWAYYETTSGGYLISNEGWDGTNGAQGFSIRTSGTKVELALGSNANWPSLKSTADIALNTWMHIAVTYSGTEIKMYINGVLDATGAAATPMVASNQSLSIGEGSMWKDRRFTGKMSDLRLWSVVRTGSEIAASMNSALAGTESGLIANWKMNEGAGSSVADATGTHTVTKPEEVLWFDLNTSIANTISDKVKATIVGNTLKVENTLNSTMNVTVYNMAGQRVIEEAVSAGNSIEKQLNNLTGVFVLKCVAIDGTSSSYKFKL